MDAYSVFLIFSACLSFSFNAAAAFHVKLSACFCIKLTSDVHHVCNVTGSDAIGKRVNLWWVCRILFLRLFNLTTSAANLNFLCIILFYLAGSLSTPLPTCRSLGSSCTIFPTTKDSPLLFGSTKSSSFYCCSKSVVGISFGFIPSFLNSYVNLAYAKHLLREKSRGFHWTAQFPDGKWLLLLTPFDLDCTILDWYISNPTHLFLTTFTCFLVASELRRSQEDSLNWAS